MYGAILGDIVGSPFEFDMGNKSKEFELFSNGCGFTDDTVMTVAVADALLTAGRDAGADEIRSLLVGKMQEWGRRYPNAGYGGRFYWWLRKDNPKPYGSYGNGSAMRVSAAGWLYDSLERTREVARYTADVTHNHPEGIKGAEAIAAVIYLARTGHGKEEIRDYVISNFGYDLSRTCDDIRPGYQHVESCQETVPEAITAFLEGQDFEDVVRTAVSLGGDCDTLTDIATAMAEAFYGMPAILKSEVRNRIPEDMKRVLESFDIALGRKSGEPDEREEEAVKNAELEQLITCFHEEPSEVALLAFVDCLRCRMNKEGQILVTARAETDLGQYFDYRRLLEGETVTIGEDIHFKLCSVVSDDGDEYLAIYTNEDEAAKEPAMNAVFNQDIRYTLESIVRAEHLKGIVFNPYGNNMILPKELIKLLLEVDADERRCRNDKL